MAVRDMNRRGTMSGAVRWARRNLFSSWWNGALTFLAVTLIWISVPPFLNWAIFDAVWRGDNRDACLGPGAGACWAFISANLEQFLYGRYPEAERWRVIAAFALGVAGLVPMLVPRLPAKLWNALYLVLAYPMIAIVLIAGDRPGLVGVDTGLWGGLLVTLVVAVTGIVASFPLGILLALGRRSDMPVVRTLSVVFIEFWRGVPLITVLFMASVMLPLFLPEGVSFDNLLRCLIGVALFSSAYMAEVVRGGLQAVPRGQYEAARAVGLGYWQTMGLIVLPQALRHVIPGIVNTFIGLFKDTTLVLIVGIFDFLGQVRAQLTDTSWVTPQGAATAYVFAALVYWLFCFGMSRYSVFIERWLNAGRAR